MLDGEDKYNQRTWYLLEITTQEQKVFRKKFWKKKSSLELTKESFFDDWKTC